MFYFLGVGSGVFGVFKGCGWVLVRVGFFEGGVFTTRLI